MSMQNLPVEELRLSPEFTEGLIEGVNGFCDVFPGSRPSKKAIKAFLRREFSAPIILADEDMSKRLGWDSPSLAWRCGYAAAIVFLALGPHAHVAMRGPTALPIDSTKCGLVQQDGGWRLASCR